MPTLKLPDGSSRSVPAGTRPRDVAESIGKRLAQKAIAAAVAGAVLDLDRELPDPDGERELSFRILTDAAGLDEKERARLRRQALDRLRIDLDAWRQLLEKGPASARPVIVQKM
jgi:hypothetical protein